MTLTAPARPGTAATVVGWSARLLFALYGAATIAATVYFTVAAPVEGGGVATAGDWVVAAWSLAMGIGFLVVAAGLGADRPRMLALVAGLLVSHLAFGLVKWFGYAEEESAVFFVVDLALLLVVGALALLGRRGGPA